MREDKRYLIAFSDTDFFMVGTGGIEPPTPTVSR